MVPEISVVIPTYQRPALLGNCLNALMQQTLSAAHFEVIVVDDGNDPATAETVNDFARRSGLATRYFGQPQRSGPAAARNRGWQAAQGRIIAFTDDDTLPQPDWLSAALTRFRRGASVVTGRVQMPLPDGPSHHDRTTAFLESAEFITANCFCLKMALQQVGGFEEAFDMAWREDSDLQFKLLRAGIPIETCAEALVIHPLRPAPWYACLRNERKNRYDALLFKRHPHLFRQRIPTYRGVVVQYYASVLGAAVGTVGLLTGQVPVAAGGFGLWALLEINLILRRLPKRNVTAIVIRQTVLTALATPFLSVYWRLYGAFKYRVFYA